MKNLLKFFNKEKLKRYGLLLFFSFFISFIPYVREVVASFIDDFLIKVENKLSYLSKNKAEDFVFVYIDGNTLESWNAKLKPLLPRDKLAKLIAKISEDNPKIIFVDVFFDFKGNKREDKKLENTLRNILKKKDITFIFPVSLEIYENNKLKPLAYFPYFYKDLKKYKDKIILSVPLFFSFKNENDGVIRYFGYKIDASYMLRDREKDIELYNSAVVIYRRYKNLKENEVDITNSDFVRSRIRYLLNMNKKNFNSISADEVLNSESNLNSENKINFKDKVVIIGVDYSFKEKKYKTPIGNIAGIYLIGNTIFTLDGHLLKDNIILSLVLSFTMLLVFSLNFRRKIITIPLNIIALIIFYFVSFTLFHWYNYLLILFIVFYLFVIGEFMKTVSDTVIKWLWESIVIKLKEKIFNK